MSFSSGMNRKNKQGVLPCFFYNSIDSTNAEAKRLIKDGKITDKGIVIAKSQTLGRGRFGREFVSPKGGVYLTYVSRVVEDYAALGLYSALAVVNVMAGLGFVNSGRSGSVEKLSVKWPNDVKLGGKKLAGILSESVVEGDNRFVLIGIGVNVNTTEKQLGILSDKATSVCINSGEKHSCRRIAANLGEAMDDVCKAYFSSADEINALREEYVSLSETLGQEIEYENKNGTKQCGKAVDIQLDGTLVVEADGVKDYIGWGEVTEIK